MDTKASHLPEESAPARSSRGKYITLVILLGWVAAVVAFTFFKFSGVAR